jgi:hypothetical protein
MAKAPHPQASKIKRSGMAKWSRRAVRQHAWHVGEIAWAWNQLHAVLFTLFWELLDSDSWEVCYAIWHSFPSDSAQRAMLKSVAVARLTPQSRGLSAVQWVIKQTDSLSGHRNDAVHSAVVYTVQAGPPPKAILKPDEITSRKAALERLAAAPLDKTWRRLRGDLVALTDYSVRLVNTLPFLGTPEAPPWPLRPRLLVTPKSSRRPAPKGRRSRRAKPTAAASVN